MKSYLKNLDTIQVVGFLVSAAVAIGLIIAGQNTVASATLGFVLAILTQFLDLQKRLSDSEERILRASNLDQALYHDDWLFKHIQQIVSDYQSLKGVWFDLLKIRADDSVLECRRVLHSVSEGYMTVDIGGPYSIGPSTFMQVKKTIKAVASMNAEYWRTSEGQTYVQANAEAVRRGVKAIRIFAYPLATLKGMVDVLEKQRDLGIEIYVVPYESLPKELDVDCCIVDDRILARSEQKQQERISIDKVEVEQAVKRFNAVLRHAKKLVDVIDGLKE